MYYGKVFFKNWVVPLFVSIVDGAPKAIIDGNAICYKGTRYQVPFEIQGYFDDMLFMYIESNLQRWLKDGTLVEIAKESDISDDQTDWVYDTPLTAAECGLPVPSWQLGQ